ncbi:hypothetical protein BOTNAR_0106g00090 [Botryotinia narcissicola]|uniref:Uncharacterized protein n=1 Tax=Botryotinia narcissicola TaxID=278944 RepID=A0A4Z1J1I0_9HELO|nr:hypothetical protein BOTNAR_0106g00090 [Botryotinia narcissicola]
MAPQPKSSSNKSGVSAPKVHQVLPIRESPKNKPTSTSAPSVSKTSKTPKAETAKSMLTKRKTGVKPPEGKENGYEADTERGY